MSRVDVINNKPDIIVARKLQNDLIHTLRTADIQDLWRRTYRTIHASIKEIDTYPVFVQPILLASEDILRKQITYPSSEMDKHRLAISANDAIHEIADVVPDIEENEKLGDITSIKLSDIVSANPNKCKIIKEDENVFFHVYSEKNKEWYPFPLPERGNVLHKGGFPRVLLKIYAQAPQNTIEAELPPNDFDAVVLAHNEVAHTEAKRIGVDDDGIEFVEEINLPRLAAQRDTTMNMCFVDKENLYFTDEALQAVKTGHIAIKSKLRKLHSSEAFIHRSGVRLVNGSGMMRLIKPVIEGKALSFDLYNLNEKYDWGTYWLVLAKKLASKKNAAELFDKLFYIGKLIHQVKPDEQDIFAVLQRVHESRPDYDFDARPQDEIAVVRWLGQKLINQIMIKAISAAFAAEPYYTQSFEEEAANLYSYRVSLDGYQSKEHDTEEFKRKWQEFVERSRERTAQFQASKKEESTV